MTFFGTATRPEPGDLFVCSAGGGVGTAVRIGQLLDGDPIRELTWLIKGRPVPAPGVLPPWDYEHAGVYLGDTAGNHYIAQAQPGGAVRVAVRDWQLGRKYVLWSTGLFPDLTDAMRANIVEAATWGTQKPHQIGYSVADYLALTAHRLGVATPELQTYIEDSGHMICSQYDDWAYQHGPYQLFDDKRWNGDVTPMDLARLFIARAVSLGLIVPPPVAEAPARHSLIHNRQPGQTPYPPPQH